MADINANKRKTIAFTGTRTLFSKCKENTDIYYSKLKRMIKDEIIELIEKEAFNYFINGLAVGSDQLCASIIIELKKFYNITLEAAIPCINQDKLWNSESKKNYQKILSLCDVKKYISNDEYKKGCMLKRNKYMVDNADIVIAIWTGKSRSGTAQTIRYANLKKVPVIIFNPDDIIKRNSY